MSRYVCMLLVLVELGMSSAEIIGNVRNANTNRVDTEDSVASNDDMTQTTLKQNAYDADCITHPRTICLNEAHCKDICIGIPNEKCQKMDVKTVKNLLLLTKNKIGMLKSTSVVEDGFVCTLDGKVSDEEWPMITITSDNGTEETREYYSDASCKNKCTFDCVECKSTDQIKSSLKKQNLQGLQLYECGPTPWWVWALVMVVILVLLGLSICVLWCCCCGCRCLACCSCGGSKAKTAATNTAQLESGTNVQAPSQAKTDTVINVVTTPPITPPRSPPHEQSRRSSRSGRSGRSSYGRHRSYRSNRTQRSDRSVSTQSNRRPSSGLEPYNRTSSSLSGSDTYSHSS